MPTVDWNDHSEIMSVNCVAYIAHNCKQTAVDALAIDSEVLVVTLYKYFHIYKV